MKLRFIHIDTNGENAGKFHQNEELYDIIMPNLLCLIINNGDVVASGDIDFEKTRPFFKSGNNGHCVYLKDGLYIAAYEFTSMIVSASESSEAHTLSDLCNELAKEHSIRSWKLN
jgi:hypothetical protein